NERYTMPAVAWLLVAASLGVAGLARKEGRPNVAIVTALGALAAQAIGVATRPAGTNPELRVAWVVAIAFGLVTAAILRVWAMRVTVLAAALFFAHVHQESKMRDQKWFFGRASRNIRDQHVVYRADWHLLGTGTDLRAVPPHESVKDEVDMADLVNERRHAYEFPHPGGGWTEMKILADPSEPRADMFDGGRRVGRGRAERF